MLLFASFTATLIFFFILRPGFYIAAGFLAAHQFISFFHHVACPKCGKEVVLKKTKKGRKYYGCEDNPECDFMSWQKPSDKKCPVCGSYMVEKGNKLVCSQETCGYVEARPKDEKED